MTLTKTKKWIILFVWFLVLLIPLVLFVFDQISSRQTQPLVVLEEPTFKNETFFTPLDDISVEKLFFAEEDHGSDIPEHLGVYRINHNQSRVYEFINQLGFNTNPETLPFGNSELFIWREGEKELIFNPTIQQIEFRNDSYSIFGSHVFPSDEEIVSKINEYITVNFPNSRSLFPVRIDFFEYSDEFSQTTTRNKASTVRVVLTERINNVNVISSLFGEGRAVFELNNNLEITRFRIRTGEIADQIARINVKTIEEIINSNIEDFSIYQSGFNTHFLNTDIINWDSFERIEVISVEYKYYDNGEILAPVFILRTETKHTDGTIDPMMLITNAQSKQP